MQSNIITFQIATHFLSRIALRIECILDIIQQACYESHQVIHRYALKNLIDLLEIIEKPELKSRFLKELMRIEYVLTKSNSFVNNNLVNHLAKQIHVLSHTTGSFSRNINELSFLKSIRQIYQPNSKDCEFNSPQLLMWLDLPFDKRQQEFAEWIDALTDLGKTVHIYLSLLRSTTFTSHICTKNGYYQYSLPPKIPCHLILLRIDKTLNIIPKLQVGHHGLTIRLYDLLSLNEIQNQTVEMELSISQL